MTTMDESEFYKAHDHGLLRKTMGVEIFDKKVLLMTEREAANLDIWTGEPLKKEDLKQQAIIKRKREANHEYRMAKKKRAISSVPSV